VDTNDLAILIGRLEREADDYPRLHLAKVVLIAAFGFLPLALCLAAAGIGLIWLIYFLIIEGRAPFLPVLLIVLGSAGAFVLVRALSVPGKTPGGRKIDADDAPALFDAIEDVVERMAFVGWRGIVHRASIHSVRIDASFDLRLHQVPRWGVFGGYRHHLQIGIPLLSALTIAELKALLAHEIGHLRSQRERLVPWLYRQRQAWRVVQQRLEHPANAVERLIGRLYGRYAVYFQAYTFVLARRLEYAADRAAAVATHPGVLANALTKLALMRRFLEEVFWPRFLSRVEEMPEPPYPPYSVMPRAFAVAHKQWARQDWLDRAVRTLPQTGDTHPSLGERFEALNIQPAPPAYAADRSALSLFGSDAPKMLRWCDDLWRKENATAWRRRHEQIMELRWKLAEYDKTPPAEASPEDLWQKAVLLVDLGDYGRAIDELQYLVGREPALAKAQLLLGKLLLQLGNERGLENLLLAAEHDAAMTDEAADTGYAYLVERGRKGEAQRFWERVCGA